MSVINRAMPVSHCQSHCCKCAACAGKSCKVPVASKEEAPKQKATGTGAHDILPKQVSSSAAAVSQQGSKRLDGRPEAKAMLTQTRKRQAVPSQQGSADVEARASSKRQRVTASHQKGTTAAKDAVRAGWCLLCLPRPHCNVSAKADCTKNIVTVALSLQHTGTFGPSCKKQ